MQETGIADAEQVKLLAEELLESRLILNRVASISDTPRHRMWVRNLGLEGRQHQEKFNAEISLTKTGKHVADRYYLSRRSFYGF